MTFIFPCIGNSHPRGVGIPPTSNSFVYGILNGIVMGFGWNVDGIFIGSRDFHGIFNEISKGIFLGELSWDWMER